MRKLLIPIVLLGAPVSAGATYYFAIKPGQPAIAAPAAVVPRAPAYVKMPTMVLPVVHEGMVSRHVVLQLTLELEDEEHAKAAQLSLNRLRDAYLRDLHIYLQRAGAPGGRIDSATLKTLLLRASDKAMGDGAVRDVLIQDVSTRKVG
jgi:hypothetical protein